MDEEFNIEENMYVEGNIDSDIEVTDEDEDKVALIGNFIRDKSSEGELTNAEDLLEEPISLEVDEVLTMIEELNKRDDFLDIVVHKGKEKVYLYSINFITKNYANMMIVVEEKDFFKMIADTVRQESKIYPRPTNVKLFSKAPFKLSKDDFLEIYNQLKKKEEYKDIQEVKASNNAIYLYSEDFMKRAHAASIAEWIEVEAEQNP